MNSLTNVTYNLILDNFRFLTLNLKKKKKKELSSIYHKIHKKQNFFKISQISSLFKILQT